MSNRVEKMVALDPARKEEPGDDAPAFQSSSNFLLLLPYYFPPLHRAHLPLTQTSQLVLNIESAFIVFAAVVNPVPENTQGLHHDKELKWLLRCFSKLMANDCQVKKITKYS